jgi:RNA exonuclease 4
MSNWKKLQATISNPLQKQHKKRKIDEVEESNQKEKEKELDQKVGELTSVLAMDGEFVGVGRNGRSNALARISIVNFEGKVVYDKFVKPIEPVTDFRTKFSGIRAKDLASDEAVSFADAQKRVSEIIKDRVVVGHSLQNDLKVLQLPHPPRSVRDLTRFSKFCPNGPVKLQILAQKFLNKSIQTGEHCSVKQKIHF